MNVDELKKDISKVQKELLRIRVEVGSNSVQGLSKVGADELFTELTNAILELMDAQGVLR